jgi:hypothetical protein
LLEILILLLAQSVLFCTVSLLYDLLLFMSTTFYFF